MGSSRCSGRGSQRQAQTQRLCCFSCLWSSCSFQRDVPVFIIVLTIRVVFSNESSQPNHFLTIHRHELLVLDCVRGEGSNVVFYSSGNELICLRRGSLNTTFAIHPDKLPFVKEGTVVCGVGDCIHLEGSSGVNVTDILENWRVTVFFPPTINYEEIRTYLDDTSERLYNCSMDGNPTPTYTWRRITALDELSCSDFCQSCNKACKVQIGNEVNFSRTCQTPVTTGRCVSPLPGTRRALIGMPTVTGTVGMPTVTGTVGMCNGCFECRGTSSLGSASYRLLVDFSENIPIDNKVTLVASSGNMTANEADTVTMRVVFNSTRGFFIAVSVLKNGTDVDLLNSHYQLTTSDCSTQSRVAFFAINDVSATDSGTYTFVITSMTDIVSVDLALTVKAGIPCKDDNGYCSGRGTCLDNPKRCACWLNTTGSRCEFECRRTREVLLDGDVKITANASCAVTEMLDCDTPVPPGLVVWHQNRAVIKHVGTSYPLVLVRASPDDSGSYSCWAGGQLLRRFVIIIQSKPMVSTIKMVQDWSSTSAKHNYTTISCPIPENVFPPATYTWCRIADPTSCNNLCLNTSECILPRSNDNPCIKSTNRHQRNLLVYRHANCSGCYECTAANKFGKASHGVIVRVQEEKCQNHPFGPVLQHVALHRDHCIPNHNQLITAQKGEIVMLSLTFESPKEVDVRWTSTASSTADLSNFTIFYDDWSCQYTVTLVIASVTMANTGNYTVHITYNGADVPLRRGTHFCSAFVLTVSPPASSSHSSLQVALSTSCSLIGILGTLAAAFVLFRRMKTPCAAQPYRRVNSNEELDTIRGLPWVHPTDEQPGNYCSFLFREADLSVHRENIDRDRMRCAYSKHFEDNMRRVCSEQFRQEATMNGGAQRQPISTNDDRQTCPSNESNDEMDFRLQQIIVSTLTPENVQPLQLQIALDQLIPTGAVPINGRDYDDLRSHTTAVLKDRIHVLRRFLTSNPNWVFDAFVDVVKRQNMTHHGTCKELLESLRDKEQELLERLSVEIGQQLNEEDVCWFARTCLRLPVNNDDEFLEMLRVQSSATGQTLGQALLDDWRKSLRGRATAAELLRAQREFREGLVERRRRPASVQAEYSQLELREEMLFKPQQETFYPVCCTDD